MERYENYLGWIESQRDLMCGAVERYAALNTHSLNVPGLRQFAQMLRTDLAPLDQQVIAHELPAYESVDDAGVRQPLPLGQALTLHSPERKGPRVFLGIHYDTVYEEHASSSLHLNAQTLWGPGVMDAKGGIVVMLFALRALEQSPYARGLSWEVLLNPDEEIGSPGSAPLLEAAARRCDIGMVFEPALPDGALVSARKGSGNYALVMRGQAAHAGRDFASGRNAVAALAEVVRELHAVNGKIPGVILNVGVFRGGTAVNIVPETAVCRFNVRFDTAEQQRAVEAELKRIIGRTLPEGFELTMRGGIHCPPKPLETGTERMLRELHTCGAALKLDLQWRPTGGVCDGNRLAAAGLPTVDTLGVRGGGAHTAEEFVELDSLVERAQLAALFLMRLGAGEINWPKKSGG